MIGALMAVICGAGVLSGADAGALEERGTAYEPQPIQTHQTDMLDTTSFPGSVRARGLIGLVRVSGTLSFERGELVWSTQDDTERGAYSVSFEGDACFFRAEYTLKSGGQVQWTGVFDGQRVHDVRIIWTRVRGDAVHDLFLPSVVTLDFTPDS